MRMPPIRRATSTKIHAVFDVDITHLGTAIVNAVPWRKRTAAVFWRRGRILPMRQVLGIVCLLGIISIAGCGGGGGAGNAVAVSPPQPTQKTPPPVQVSISSNPGSVDSGQSATLTWSTVPATTCTAGGGWFGSRPSSGSQTIGPLIQSTTFSLTCAATATTSTGSAKLAITVNSQVPAPTASHVVSNSLQTSLNYLRVGVAAADLAWDPQTSELLVITEPASPLDPDSLLSVDPSTGIITNSVSLGTTPTALAVSSDGQYIYVGLTDGVIRRFVGADLAPDITFSIGSNATYAPILRIEVSPTSSHTIAVIAPGLSGDTLGMNDLGIFDDSVARPKMLVSFTPLPDQPAGCYMDVASANWSADGSNIMVTFGAYCGGVVDLAVTSQGVSVASQSDLWLGGFLSFHGDTVYSDGGLVFSLTGPVQQLGRMPDYSAASVSRVESLSRGLAFSDETHLTTGSVEDGTLISVFDLNNLSLIDNITFDGAALFGPGKIITWGNDGLAIGGSNLIIASGSFAAARGTQPTQPLATPPVLASGTTTDGLLSYQVLDVSARDVAADSCGDLFVATDATSLPYPSSVLKMDAATNTVTGVVHITGEPFNLAASDDCSTLYVGLAGSNSVARVNIPDMSVTAVLPLGIQSGSYALLRARSLSVAPGLPLTVAVAKGVMDDASLCNGTDGGVEIFDDQTPRPVQYGQSNGYSIKSIAWGASASVLYGEDWTDVYAFSVDSSGANNPVALFPYWDGNSQIYDLGHDLYFDSGSNRLFNSVGDVFDVSTDTELGPIKLINSAETAGSCGTPTVARVADRTSGKAFFVTWNSIPAEVLDIAAYDRTNLTLAGHETLDASDYGPGFSFPLRVARPTSDSLAVVTDSGQLILLQGPLLEP